MKIEHSRHGWLRGGLLTKLLLISTLRSVVKAAAIEGQSQTKELAAKIKARLDETVKPCDDFYQFACGGYTASTPIPADRESTGVVGEISDRIKEQINEILCEADSDKDIGPFKLAKLLYRKCMDEGKPPLRVCFTLDLAQLTSDLSRL